MSVRFRVDVDGAKDPPTDPAADMYAIDATARTVHAEYSREKQLLGDDGFVVGTETAALMPGIVCGVR